MTRSRWCCCSSVPAPAVNKHSSSSNTTFVAPFCYTLVLCPVLTGMWVDRGSGEGGGVPSTIGFILITIKGVSSVRPSTHLRLRRSHRAHIAGPYGHLDLPAHPQGPPGPRPVPQRRPPTPARRRAPAPRLLLHHPRCLIDFLFCLSIPPNSPFAVPALCASTTTSA